jgi:hypothetical protein
MSCESSSRISKSRLRKFSPADVQVTSVRLVEATSKAPGKIVSKLWDQNKVIALLLNDEVSHYIIDDQVLVVYDVAEPWYSYESMVQELLVLRLQAGSTDLQAVDSLLMDIADEAMARGTVVGGALSDRPRALSRRYQQLGYSEQDSPELVKWRQHGWSPQEAGQEHPQADGQGH